MADNLIAAAALREAFADHIRAAAEIAEGKSERALAHALSLLAIEAIDAPASRMLNVVGEVSARIEELRAVIALGG